MPLSSRRPIEQVVDGARTRRRDALAVEEPLEIRVVPKGGEPVQVAVTMRTPGADFELAAGFLYGEGLIQGPEAVESIRYCLDATRDGPQEYNVVSVHLAAGVAFDAAGLGRNFYVSSSCGVCGKASIEAVMAPAAGAVRGALRVESATLLGLPARLRSAQGLFERTGGVHAAGLFTADGTLVRVREDVGRHNALDKVVGASLLAGEVPLGGRILLVSGRLSFELVQKAVRAGAEVLAGVSAPSSLAAELADASGLTLVGFLRDSGFNIYTGGERIVADAAPRVAVPTEGESR